MKIAVQVCLGLVLMVGRVACATAEALPPLPAECAGRETVEPRPPSMPEGLKEGDRGIVTLVIDHDACGMATRVTVEKSSGIPALDAAASDAARTWHFSPPVRDGKAVAGRVRVPVDFDTDATYSRSPSRSAGFERDLEQWRRMQVPEVQADADATVPSYLPDPQAMPVASVDEAVALLSSKGEQMRAPSKGVSVYRLYDGLDISTWELHQAGSALAPSVIRRRLVSDGKKAFWVSNGLCGSQEALVCERFDAAMRIEGRQRTIPPPPTPPGEHR